MEFDKKKTIRFSQYDLTNLGLYDGKADGIIGPKTRAALRKYQQTLGLPLTGELDEVTRESLQETARLKVLLLKLQHRQKFGVFGPRRDGQIEEIERKLNARGFQ